MYNKKRRAFYLILVVVFCVLGLITQHYCPYPFVHNIMFCLSIICCYTCMHQNIYLFLIFSISGLVSLLSSLNGLSNIHNLIQQNTHTVWLKLSYVLLLSLMICIGILIIKCYKHMRIKNTK